MRYLIYIRTSKKTQVVENQLKECRDYVAMISNPADEILEFSEPDRSTMLPMARRPKLLAMMRTLLPGDVLVVYKVDRLARDVQELINIYFDIKKKGVRIHGIKDPELNDQNICIYAFIASSERKNIQERTKTALQRKKSKLEKVGSTLYGYKTDQTKLQPREQVPSSNKPYLLVPDDHELEQISIMKDLFQKGYSYGEIAIELEKQGFRNRKGNPIHKKSVWNILKRLKVECPYRPSLTSV